MNKPQIRFKGYDDEWQQAKVKDVFTLGNGYTPSKANPSFWTNGTIPWFRMEDIRENGRILSDSIQHVTPEAIKSSGLFPAGSIIVSTTATIGEHALLIADSLANQQFTVFQTVNRWSWLKAKYLLYRFYGLGDWCRRNVNAGGLAAVSISDLQKYVIDYPSSELERDSIADYFSNLDKMIAEVKREITRLENMKQASLQKMFPRPGDTAPEIRFAGFTEPWEETTLGRIAEIYQPQTISQTELIASGFPVYGANGLIGYYSKYNHELPQIAITCRGNTCGTVNFTPKHTWITGNAMVVNLDNSEVIKGFIFFYLQSKNMTTLISGSGQPQITRKPIADYIVYIPLIDEQKAIDEYFRNIDTLISAKHQKLVKLRNIKQACLEKMFVNTSEI